MRTFVSGRERIAQMTVKTMSGADYLIRLYEDRKLILSVYIRGGATETFNVPLGTHELKWATGTTWQDYWSYFGPETSYMKADDTLSFRAHDYDRSGGYWVSGHTITLYTVPGGNMGLTPILASEF